MTSLLNVIIADKVEALLADDALSTYADDERAMSKQTALGIIHAVLWLHSTRSGSFASAYATDALANAIGTEKLETLLGWSKIKPPSSPPQHSGDDRD